MNPHMTVLRSALGYIVAGFSGACNPALVVALAGVAGAFLFRGA